MQWVEAVVGKSLHREEGERSDAVGLIVHGPGGVRMEIREEKQVEWAAKLLRQLHEASSC